MQRKPGYPVANCSIKMPDNAPSSEGLEEEEPPQRRQQLINFGHAQWGFNNWSWGVSKQDLDFCELSCGKYTAGVAAFVSVTVKPVDIHRENVGYGTSLAHSKGLAIHRARKCAVTNALRETLLSFGGAVASELLEMDAARELPAPSAPSAPLAPPAAEPENNPNLANKPPAPPPAVAPAASVESLVKNTRKDDAGPLRPAGPPVKNAPAAPPPVAKALPMPVNLPPAANRPPPRAPPPPGPAPQHPPHPHAPHVPHAAHAPHAAPQRPNSNEARGDSEEARAERKRRQRLAQEEFRLKQLQRQGQEEKQELDSISTSVDNLLMAIPTQEVNVKQTGDTEAPAKRKSPAPDGGAAKRMATALSRIDVQDP